MFQPFIVEILTTTENRQRESTRKIGKKMTYRKYLIACYKECVMKGYDGNIDGQKRQRKRHEPSKVRMSTKEEDKQTTE